MISSIRFRAAMITIVLITLFISGAAAWFAIALMRERSELALLVASQGEDSKKSTYDASVRALLRDSESERRELTALTAGRDPVAVIRTLEDVARAVGASIVVDAVNSGGASNADPSLASFLLATRATGTFDTLHRLIALMEALPFPSRIEKMKLEKMDKQWQASVVVRVFTHEKL